MKITICCKKFGRAGGAETFLLNFARCLLDDGHEVKVITPEAGANMPGVSVERLSVPPVPRALRDYVLARTTRRALAAETEADVTFSDQRCWGADVVRPGGGVQRAYVPQRDKSYPTALRRGINRVLRSVSPREWFRIRIDDKLYAPPGPVRIVANSNMVRRNLERFYPHVKDRIRVVYNGADPEQYYPGLRKEHRERIRTELGIPADALVGVFVSHDWRRKGLYPFMEALGIRARRDEGTGRQPVIGLVVGRGNQSKAEAFARRYGAEDRLRFVGPADPAPCYGAADVLVLPTYFDPCANVTVEGLACGLPAITTVYDGAHGLITPGENGFYLPEADDSARLAEHLEYFMDEERLAAARTAAAAKAAEHTMHDMFQQIMDVLKEAAEAKG